MPKIISDYERKRTQEAIIRHTKQLIIAKKGIKDITVDDIVRSVGMGKGSFYSYFKSKEECLYHVVESTVYDVYVQIELIKQENLPTKEKAIKFLQKVYLADDRVGFYINTTDIEALFRKLPPEYADLEQKFIGEGLIADIMGFMDLSKAQAEAFFTLLQCIEFVFLSDVSNDAKQEVIDSLVKTISEYVEKHSNV